MELSRKFSEEPIRRGIKNRFKSKMSFLLAPFKVFDLTENRNAKMHKEKRHEIVLYIRLVWADTEKHCNRAE